jgi:WW domain
VYYLCEQTQISQWVRPRASEAVAINEDAIPPTTSGEPESAPERTELDELPEGWVEMTDEASGLPYYVHDDGTSTWDRPVQSSLNEGSVGSAPLSEHAQVETETTPETVTALDSTEAPPEWTEPIDCTSPGDIDNELERTEPANVDHPRTDEVAVEALPLGWVELIDPTTALPYFFNEGTNETSWDRPVDPVGSHDDRDMLEGWEEVIEESTGQTYYFNSETGESSWDRPQTSTLAKASSRDASYETARRPAHAVATFGFGGRLCLVHGGSPVVSIRRTGTLVVGNAVLDVEKAKMEAGIDGPLSSADASSVLSYLARRSSDSEKQRRMLWKLIMIASGANGRLRSDRPADDSQSPEEAVLRLLKDFTRSSEVNGDFPMPLVNNSNLAGTCVGQVVAFC